MVCKRGIKNIVFSQIALLILQLFAATYLLASSVSIVSAADSLPRVFTYNEEIWISYGGETYRRMANGAWEKQIEGRQLEFEAVEDAKLKESLTKAYDSQKSTISNTASAPPAALISGARSPSLVTVWKNGEETWMSVDGTAYRRLSTGGWEKQIDTGKGMTYEAIEDSNVKSQLTKAYDDNKGMLGGAAAAANTPQAIGYDIPFKKTPWTPSYAAGHLFGNLLEGLTWATTALTITQLIGNFVPGDKGEMVKNVGLAISAGIMAGKATAGAFSWFNNVGQDKTGGTATLKGWQSGASIAVGLLVTYIIAAKTVKETKTKEATIEFKCMSWQAPRGGDDCTKCNKDPLRPCSEYRCKSLGQTCMLINKGTGFEKCIDSGRDDTTSPGIKPWKEKLTVGYEYTDVKPRPAGSSSGSSGMRIVDKTNADGCLKAFTPFTFGIETTEKDSSLQPAQCKIDFNHTTKFDEMQYYLGDNNLYADQHEQTMALPGTDALNKILEEANGTLNVKNDGEYSLYYYDYSERRLEYASEEYV